MERLLDADSAADSDALLHPSSAVGRLPAVSDENADLTGSRIGRYLITGLIGKGGMGAKTLHACQEHGCVYLHAIGGAAQIYAACITSVPRVFLKEKFGSPEAVWEMEVKDFPAVVTMDAHGRSLHQEIADVSKNHLHGVLAGV